MSKRALVLQLDAEDAVVQQPPAAKKPRVDCPALPVPSPMYATMKTRIQWPTPPSPPPVAAKKPGVDWPAPPAPPPPSILRFEFDPAALAPWPRGTPPLLSAFPVGCRIAWERRDKVYTGRVVSTGNNSLLVFIDAQFHKEVVTPFDIVRNAEIVYKESTFKWERIERENVAKK